MSDKSIANRLYTENEVQVFYLMGRFQRLVKPDHKDIHQVLDHTKAKFTELQSLALEFLHDQLLTEIEGMSSYIAELEMSAGIAKFAGEDTED